MKPLSELSIDMKVLTTVTLLFAGLAIIMALIYLDLSHRDLSRGLVIGPSDIVATYYGPGDSVETLISLAHIHMLGLLTLFWLIGFIFLHSSVATGWKIFWSTLPYVAFLADVSGWFLTKMNPKFVYVVIAGGGLFILALVVMIFVSLYEMWLKRPKRL
jgi:hypothetical protein